MTRTSMTPWLTLILIVFTLLGGCSTAPTRPDALARGDEDATRRYLEKLIDHEMGRSGTPGLSIALVDDQRVVWAQGFGFADLERKLPATPSTVYRVGSISKLLTDVAAMQLVEQGRLRLDEPLQTYLPEFSIRQRRADAPPITVRQLMTHHAGLPRDLLKGFQAARPAPFDSVIRDLQGETAAYAPGQIFWYSNVGVTLLGSVVERVGAMPFAAHMQRAVLQPLGMSDAAFEPGVSASPWMATGYHRRDPKPEPPLRDVPAGGLNASVSDLSRFISMVFAGGMSGPNRVLRAETVEAMLSPQNGSVPLDMNFHVGLGWMLSTLGRSTLQGAGVVAHHAGAIAGFRSQLYLLPQHKLGVVVLANSDTATEAVDRVATEALAVALEAKTGIKQPPHVPVPPSGDPVPAAAAASLAGDYTTLVGPARIVPIGGKLRAEVAGHTFDLVQRRDGMFALDYALLGLVHLDLGPLSDVGLAVRQVSGHQVLVARIGAQEMLVGDRVTPPADLGAWRRRLGDYAITNLGDDRRFIERLRLVEDRGYLVVELTATDSPKRTDRLLLKPLSDDEAIVLGPLSDGGESIRVRMVEGEEHLVASGLRARRVRADTP